jgi:hypothetical protein
VNGPAAQSARALAAWLEGRGVSPAEVMTFIEAAGDARGAVAFLSACAEPAKSDYVWAQRVCDHAGDLEAAVMLVVGFGVDARWGIALGERLEHSAGTLAPDHDQMLSDLRALSGIQARNAARCQAMALDTPPDAPHPHEGMQR